MNSRLAPLLAVLTLTAACGNSEPTSAAASAKGADSANAGDIEANGADSGANLDGQSASSDDSGATADGSVIIDGAGSSANDTVSIDSAAGMDAAVAPSDADPNGGSAADLDASKFPYDPWKIHVVVLQDLGSTAGAYQSDFQGGAAVLGDATFSGFSLNALAKNKLPRSLYAGGDVKIQGAINNGGVEVAGDLHMNGASVDGDVHGGGDLLGTGGSITGDVSLAGSKKVATVTVSGKVEEGKAFKPTLDLPALGKYFLAVSAKLAKAKTTAQATFKGGLLHVPLVKGDNVVELKAEWLETSWGITIEGPETARLFANVPGKAVKMAGKDWQLKGGVKTPGVLFNFPDTELIELSGGNHMVSFLAPKAKVKFAKGLATGNFICQGLDGGGQLNEDTFLGDPWLPW